MSAFGTLFREMRQGKRLSQMDFALECDVSAKHISFLETGRSKPSKGMVLHLAQMLQAHLPYPAVVFDHEYYLVAANQAMQELMARIVTMGAQNLRIEHFFSMDEASKAYWKS